MSVIEKALPYKRVRQHNIISARHIHNANVNKNKTIIIIPKINNHSLIIMFQQINFAQYY